MRTEKEIIERMKQVEEACILAVKFDVPTTSFELMLKVLDWVLQNSGDSTRARAGYFIMCLNWLPTPYPFGNVDVISQGTLQDPEGSRLIYVQYPYKFLSHIFGIKVLYPHGLRLGYGFRHG